MLQFFRNFFSSKVGIGVTLGFVGLIALSFAGSGTDRDGRAQFYAPPRGYAVYAVKE